MLKQKDGADMELSERKKKILKAVVESYIETAEPVGSKTIAASAGLGVSSATIRNELAELPAVRIGDTVGVGDVVGAVGETALGEIGDVTHLHFAMSVDGAPVDPRDILPAR